MITEQDFFFSENEVKTVNEDLYNRLELLIRSTEAMARSLYQSVYLIDYYKKGFLFVSDNPSFLCGRTAKEVQEMGYSFYMSNVPEEDQKMLVEINSNGFKFYEDKITSEDKYRCYITYDFHLINQSGKKVLVNHKLTPVQMTPDGRIWIALCVVSLSSKKKAGNVEFHIQGIPRYWSYSFESHRWKPQEKVELKPEEKQVLTLSSQGYTMNEIADKMCRSVDSVKFYRRNLFERLEVKKITEALSYSAIYKLL